MTRKELEARADISASAKRQLSKMFGKLELRFTKSRCYAALSGQTFVTAYQIVAKDDTSLAIVSEGHISHIHFEGTRFWVLIGSGTLREHFRRIRTPRIAASRKRPLARA